MTPLHDDPGFTPSDPGSLAGSMPPGRLTLSNPSFSDPTGLHLLGDYTLGTPIQELPAWYKPCPEFEAETRRGVIRSDADPWRGMYAVEEQRLTGGVWETVNIQFVPENFVSPGWLEPNWIGDGDYTDNATLTYGAAQADSLAGSPGYSPADPGSLAGGGTASPADPGGLVPAGAASPGDVGSLAGAGGYDPEDPGSLLGPGGTATPGAVGPLVPAAPEPPAPSDAVRRSPQDIPDAEKDQVLANLGLPPKGTYLFADADRGAPLGNDRVAVRFGPDSESTPLSLTANGLWIGGNSSTLGEFTAVRGLEGWATMEGTDGGVAFRWKSDNPESDKLGFAFDFEGPFLAAFGNLLLTANRKYQMPNLDGTVALFEQVLGDDALIAAAANRISATFTSGGAATGATITTPINGMANRMLITSGSGSLSHGSRNVFFANASGSIQYMEGGWMQIRMVGSITADGDWCWVGNYHPEDATNCGLTTPYLKTLVTNEDRWFLQIRKKAGVAKLEARVVSRKGSTSKYQETAWVELPGSNTTTEAPLLLLFRFNTATDTGGRKVVCYAKTTPPRAPNQANGGLADFLLVGESQAITANYPLVLRAGLMTQTAAQSVSFVLGDFVYKAVP